jgi:homoaconitase/3-isopropylmalate dehydratase large subunit
MRPLTNAAGKLKRNTVAFERAVEYGGNIKPLSCDARFAIANMTVRAVRCIG